MEAKFSDIYKLIEDKTISSTDLDQRIKESCKFRQSKDTKEIKAGFSYPKVLKELKPHIEEFKLHKYTRTSAVDLRSMPTNGILYVIYHVMCNIVDRYRKNVYLTDLNDKVRASRAGVCKVLGEQAYEMQKVAEYEESYRAFCKTYKKNMSDTQHISESVFIKTKPTSRIIEVVSKYEQIFQDIKRVYELGFEICALCELYNVFKLTNKEGLAFKKKISNSSESAFIEIDPFLKPDYIYDFQNFPRFSEPALYTRDDFFYKQSIDDNIHYQTLFTSKNFRQFSVSFSETRRETLNKTLIVPYVLDYLLYIFIVKNLKKLCVAKVLEENTMEGGQLEEIINKKRYENIILDNERDDSKIKSEKNDRRKQQFLKFKSEERMLRGEVARSWEYKRILELVSSIFKRNIKTTLYFTQYFDFRGRIYRRSVLAPQYNKLAKALVGFKDGYTVDEKNIITFCTYIGGFFKKHQSFKASHDWVEKHIGELINLHENFKIAGLSLCELEEPLIALNLSLHFYRNCTEKALGNFSVGKFHFKCFYTNIPLHLDATASAFQILGVITGSVDVCKASNIIPSTQESCQGPEKKRDIYDEIAVKLRLEKDTNSIYDVLPPFLFERTIIKSIHMKKSYGLTNYGIRQSIIEGVPSLSPTHLTVYVNLINSSWEKHFSEINLLFNFYFALGAALGTCNQPLVFSIDEQEHSVVKQGYNKVTHEKIRLSFTLRKRYKTKSIMIHTYDQLKGDRDKSANSTAANITHSMDGQLCLETVRYMHKKFNTNIPIFTNHDCFSTTLPYITSLTQAYNQSFKNLFNSCPFHVIENLFNVQLDGLLKSRIVDLKNDETSDDFSTQFIERIKKNPITFEDFFFHLSCDENEAKYIYKFIEAYKNLNAVCRENVIDRVKDATCSLFL